MHYKLPARQLFCLLCVTERINQALQALNLVGTGLFNAVGIKLTTLPVIEVETANIGDGVLCLGYTQTAETAGEIVILTITTVVFHLGQLIRVYKCGCGGREQLCTAYGLYRARGQAQSHYQYGNEFFHTRRVIT